MRQRNRIALVSGAAIFVFWVSIAWSADVSVDPGNFKYDPDRVKSNTVCTMQKDAKLKCDPPEITLRGDGPSSIRIARDPDAPKIKKIVVSAGQSYRNNCLNFDEIDYKTNGGSSDDILILLHLDTVIFPSYNPYGRGIEKNAVARLRGSCKGSKVPNADKEKKAASLPIDTQVPYATVTAYDDADKAWTYHVPLRQRTWWIDTGVLISWAKVPRETVRTQVVAGSNQLRVIEHLVEREPDYNTGVLVTAYPNNYPNFGVSLGIGSVTEGKPAWAAGLSVRLLSEQKSSVATITVGRAWMPTKVFKVEEGQVLDPGDGRLAGQVIYKSTTFVGLQVGFAIKGF